MVSIRFRWCPPEYRQSGTTFRTLVEQATGEVSVLVESRRQAVDVEMVSSLIPLTQIARLEFGRASRRVRLTEFGQRARWEQLNPAPRDRKFARSSIWFTGENLRPPSGEWDGYLSFDVDPLGGRNAYFPFWWEALGVVGRPTFNFLGKPLTVDTCLSPRPTTMSRRPGFVCAFVGNPTPMRLHAVRALSAYGTVDVFGRAVGRPVRSKLEVARRYKFVLSFENDYYPGYVTEKAFDAWGAGAVPIWWGADPERYLNRSAIIDLADFSGVDEMSCRVATIASSREDWEEMSASPILTRSPDLQPAIDMLRKALGA